MSENAKVLRRSRKNRMIGGVMGGLAEYFGLDTSLLRLVYVIGSILSAAFPGALVYVIMWVVIPKEDR